MTSPAKRCQAHDSYIRAGPASCLEQYWQELLDYHGVREVVGRKLRLEPVLAQRRRDSHNAGVAHEYVESVVGESLGCGLHRGKGLHVHFQERCAHRFVDLPDLGFE